MKLIPVGRNHFAKVDDDDFERLSAYQWGALKHDHLIYAEATIDGKKVKMERLVTGDFESYCIDHKDRDSLNNQKDNLRPADRYQNASNRRDRQKPKNPEGFGVHLGCRGYRATVSVHGKHLTFGPFTDAESAQRAYDAMRFLTSGEFAPLNRPDEVQDSIVALKDHLATCRKEYIQRVVTALGSKREAAKALGISEASIYREQL